MTAVKRGFNWGAASTTFGILFLIGVVGSWMGIELRRWILFFPLQLVAAGAAGAIWSTFRTRRLRMDGYTHVGEARAADESAARMRYQQSG
jgi:hypothetical protein